MRHVFIIYGVNADNSKYAVIAYDSINECKRHFDKLNKELELANSSQPNDLREYDRTGTIPAKYVVTKIMQQASFKGFEWFYKLGQWLHLRENKPDN